ncbi:MAG: hypothetical protein E8D47_07160 [Nitrospira sp.]|nr:MAG: hypothetical protein E8D47_07160 [Nitrospira sp.]
MRILKMRILIAMTAIMGFICIGGPASAELVLWHIDGTITGVRDPYIIPGDPGPTPAQQAASQNALALFPIGSSYSTEITVDLEAPYTPTSGSASFEGSIKSYNVSVLASGYSYFSSQPVTQGGVSITPDSPSGDVIYFYLPLTLAFGNQPPALLASFRFIDPNGSLSTSQNLHDLFMSFDTSHYSLMDGFATIYHGDCLYLTCGSTEFSIASASVSPVPLPPSAVLLIPGLAVIGWVARLQRGGPRNITV